jgi:hypothetical protein
MVFVLSERSYWSSSMLNCFCDVSCALYWGAKVLFPLAFLQHFFASFLSRDEAFRLIIDGWVQHTVE